MISHYTIVLLTDVKKVTVTPTWLSKKIFKESYTVSVLPALLMSGGLPDSGKSEAIQTLFCLPSKLVPEFSHYETVATGLSLNKSIQARWIDDPYLYSYGYYSGFIKNLAMRSKWAAGFNDDSASIFKDSILQSHLHNIMQCLQCTMQPTDEREKHMALKKMKGIAKGVGLIKVWDLTFNSITLQFLYRFSGHLYNSYMWLFTDIERDRQQLHKPPSPKAGSTNIRRSRLEYLVATSKLTSHLETQRKNTCNIFAKYNDQEKDQDSQQSSTQNGKIEQPKSQDDQQSQREKLKDEVKKLKKECLNAAPQLGVKDLIIEEVIPINFAEETTPINLAKEHQHHRLLKHLKQQITRAHDEIPLSHIFLRGALDLQKSIFIRRDELKEKAKECNIGSKGFNDFCRFFTSFGSILDVSLVNSECDIVIIKPNVFLSTLDRAFNPQKIKEKEKLRVDGIITEELAFTVLFPKEGDMFLEVLEATGLVTDVTGRCSSEYARCGRSFYMPSVRKNEEVLRYNPKAIQLVRSVRYPSVNMEVAITKYILAKIPNAFLMPSEMDNVTVIHLVHDNTEVNIKIIYQGGVIEFVIETPKIAIFSWSLEKIIDGCQEIAEMNSARFGEPKYHFGALCALDEQPLAFNFGRKRHVFPDDQFCDLCIENQHHNKYTKAWNEALKNVSFQTIY